MKKSHAGKLLHLNQIEDEESKEDLEEIPIHSVRH